MVIVEAEQEEAAIVPPPRDLDARAAGPPSAGSGWEKELAARWPALWRRAVGRLGDAHAADDFVQETMVRAWPAIQAGRIATAAMPAYLRTTLDHLLVDHFRATRRRPVLVELDQAEDRSAPEDPAAEVLRHLDAKALRDAFACLNSAERQVLTWRLVSGLSAKQVAARTGQTPGAVRVQQYRALRHLAVLVQLPGADGRGEEDG